MFVPLPPLRGQHTVLFRVATHLRTDRVGYVLGRSRIRTRNYWFSLRCTTIEPPLLLTEIKMNIFIFFSFIRLMSLKIIHARTPGFPVPYDKKTTYKIEPRRDDDYTNYVAAFMRFCKTKYYELIVWCYGVEYLPSQVSWLYCFVNKRIPQYVLIRDDTDHTGTF